MPNVELKTRKYHSEDGFTRLRAMLRDTFLLNDRLERSWSVPRLEYWRWHHIETCETPPVDQVTHLWETIDGRLVAALHCIDFGEAYLHVHPRFRCAELENEMFACAERHLSREYSPGERKLFVLADEDDKLRREVLEARGYSRRDHAVHRWRRDLDTPIPKAEVAEGYAVRSMGGAAEYASRALASFRAFHPNDPEEEFGGGDWYANLQSAPLYRQDLDVVAESPEGDIAAFSTIFYDPATYSAVCVLVGTSPEHQRRGLGKAVIGEGLRRLQLLGGTRVFANGFDRAGNALYGSVLGTGYRSESFYKVLD